jgi:hypothetical protein
MRGEGLRNNERWGSGSATVVACRDSTNHGITILMRDDRRALSVALHYMNYNICRKAPRVTPAIAANLWVTVDSM